MNSGKERWVLPSGVWLREAAPPGWTLDRTPLQRPARISGADLYELTGAARTPSVDGAGPATHLPPEFRYCPDSGAALVVPEPPAPAPWLPPHGSAPQADTPGPGAQVGGLHRTAFALRPRPAVARPAGDRPAMRPADPAAHALPPPPPGSYEFCVARFGARRDVLLAVEPQKGLLFAWLPHAGEWQALEHPSGGRLEDAAPAGRDWRMELVQDGTATTLFLPTAAGLAAVRPEALSLGYEAGYLGGGPAVGAPVRWSGDVWAPVRRASGEAVLAGASGRVLPLPLPAQVRQLAPPVHDAREVIWAADEGQLVVRRGAGGTPETAWIEWPAGVRPRFEFGSPYLSRAGAFWQNAWDEAESTHLFVQMGRPEPQRRPVPSPRFCTGSQSWQRGHHIEGDPWLDPDPAGDAGLDEVVVPLLESAHRDGVLALAIDTTSSAADLLASHTTQRAVVQYRADDCADLRFFTLLVAQPWRARAFVFERRLWLYHPDERQIHGWDREG